MRVVGTAVIARVHLSVQRKQELNLFVTFLFWSVYDYVIHKINK